jgi:hypothetical protein
VCVRACACVRICVCVYVCDRMLEVRRQAFKQDFDTAIKPSTGSVRALSAHAVNPHVWGGYLSHVLVCLSICVKVRACVVCVPVPGRACMRV